MSSIPNATALQAEQGRMLCQIFIDRPSKAIDRLPQALIAVYFKCASGIVFVCRSCEGSWSGAIDVRYCTGVSVSGAYAVICVSWSVINRLLKLR